MTRQVHPGEASTAGAGGSDGGGDRLPPALELEGLRLLRQIGAGGHAVVYEALQAGTGQRVAVKMLRAGIRATAAQRARFEQEVRLAARLHHESIVRVLGSGWLGETPYLVLELVDGRPLDDWLASDRPSTRRRVALFSAICSAVATAHFHMIVHRDLKPSNVLVDPRGRPKVLDFGVAREMGGSDLTADGEFVGTMSWAAPEQVLAPATVDASTDIFALGLLLYYLLTGRQPQDLSALSLAGAAEVIASRQVPRPSRSADGIGCELDAIVGMATQRDPERRYRSVDALRADVEAWLQGRPVAARRPTPGYVAWKLVQRHPVRAALIVAIGCLSVVAIAGWVQATRAEASARQEAAEATAVADYVVGFFEMASSGRGRGEAGGAWSLLEAGYRGTSLRSSPRTEMSARLLMTMGRAYEAAGYPDRADSMYVDAVAACRMDQDASGATLADALASRMRSQVALGRPAAARELHEEAVSLRRALFGDRSIAAWSSRVDEAWLRRAEGNHVGAEGLLRETLAASVMSDPAAWPLRADALELLASILEARGEVEPAIVLLHRARRARDSRHSDTDPACATVRLRLGRALVTAGRPAEADQYLREAVGMRVRILGIRSPAAAEATLALAEACLDEGRAAEAALLADDVLAVWREVHGAEHPRIDEAENLRRRASARSAAIISVTP